jgi:hypothetical protein
MLRISEQDQRDLQAVIDNFPALLDRAIVDRAKLHEGVKAGLFTEPQVREAMTWFNDFPRYWAELRPNITDRDVRKKADLFSDELSPGWAKRMWEKIGFGFLPFLVIGLIILGAGITVYSVVSLIKYWKKQQNISAMISAVVDGKLPVSILEEAIAQENSNLVTNVSAALGQLALVAGIIIFAPTIMQKIKGKK